MRKLLILTLWIMVGLLGWSAIAVAPYRYCEGRNYTYQAVYASDNQSVLLQQNPQWGLVERWGLNSDGPLQIYHFHPNRLVATNSAPRLMNILYAPNGKSILTHWWHFNGSAVLLWDPVTGELLFDLDDATNALYAADGKTVLTSNDEQLNRGIGQAIPSTVGDGIAKLWDATTGKALVVLQKPAATTTCFAYAPDGRTVLTGANDGIARLWDGTTGELLFALPKQNGGVTGVAYAPDGTFLVTGHSDGVARLWDAATGKLLSAFQSNVKDISNISYSASAKTVLVHDIIGTVELWDVATGKLLSTSPGYAARTLSATYAPDGKTIISIDNNRAILWDAATGRMLHPFCPRVLNDRWQQVGSVVVLFHLVLPLGLFWRARSSPQRYASPPLQPQNTNAQ